MSDILKRVNKSLDVVGGSKCNASIEVFSPILPPKKKMKVSLIIKSIKKGEPSKP